MKSILFLTLYSFFLFGQVSIEGQWTIACGSYEAVCTTFYNLVWYNFSKKITLLSY